METHTYRVEALASGDSLDGPTEWVVAARRGPKMDNGPATGLSIEEATALLHMLERTGSPARITTEF